MGSALFSDIEDAAAWDLTRKRADALSDKDVALGPKTSHPTARIWCKFGTTLMTFSQRKWLDGRNDIANVCMSTTKPDA